MAPSLTLVLLLVVGCTAGATVTRKASFRSASGSPVKIGVGDAPVSVVTGDFNKDGFLDLAIANSNDNTVTILLGHGDGTFTPAPNSPHSTGGDLTRTVAVGDFNVDGKLDVVATDLPGGLTLVKSSDFVGFANQIEHEVCDTKDMPHAQVPFGVDGKKIGFRNDAIAQHDLGNFLNGQGIGTCLPHD